MLTQQQGQTITIIQNTFKNNTVTVWKYVCARKQLSIVGRTSGNMMRDGAKLVVRAILDPSTTEIHCRVKWVIVNFMCFVWLELKSERDPSWEFAEEIWCGHCRGAVESLSTGKAKSCRQNNSFTISGIELIYVHLIRSSSSLMASSPSTDIDYIYLLYVYIHILVQ